MRKELEQKIVNEFPFMKRQKSYEEQKENGGIYDLYGAFGCDVGDGWFSIIWGLCEDITSAYERAGKEIDFVPAQVKEKFGVLRFYYDVGGEKKGIYAFDSFGAGSIRFQKNDSPLYKEIAELVRKWEEKILSCM